eukprot:scaffold44832_cov63-Phaeocystis_antarctica.AAC.1
MAPSTSRATRSNCLLYSAAVHVYSQARGLAAMQAKLLVSKHVSCLALQVRKLASRTPKRARA